MGRKWIFVVAAVLALVFAEAALTDNYQYQRTAQDDAKAAAAVLRRSEFPPGWKNLKGGLVKPDETPSTSKDRCDGYLPREADLSVTGDAEADYRDAYGILSLFSSVRLFKTKAMAAADWNRQAPTDNVACLRKAFAQNRNPRQSVVSMTRLHTLPCAFQNGSSVIEVAAHYQGKPDVHFILVETHFRSGRTEGAVVTLLRKVNGRATMTAIKIHSIALAIFQPRLPAT